MIEKKMFSTFLYEYTLYTEQIVNFSLTPSELLYEWNKNKYEKFLIGKIEFNLSLRKII